MTTYQFILSNGKIIKTAKMTKAQAKVYLHSLPFGSRVIVLR
jgi:hypothetical protein